MFHFDESFWVAVAFVTFIALIIKPVANFIAGALDNRSEGIKNDIEEAQRLKEEAQSVLALYQRKQRKTMEEAEEIIAHAEEEAKRIITSAKDSIEAEIAKRTELAMQKIAQAEASVVQEIKENAVDITMSTARALIVENLGKDAAEEIINRAISDIDRKFH